MICDQIETTPLAENSAGGVFDRYTPAAFKLQAEEFRKSHSYSVLDDATIPQKRLFFKTCNSS